MLDFFSQAADAEPVDAADSEWPSAAGWISISSGERGGWLRSSRRRWFVLGGPLLSHWASRPAPPRGEEFEEHGNGAWPAGLAPPRLAPLLTNFPGPSCSKAEPEIVSVQALERPWLRAYSQ